MGKARLPHDALEYYFALGPGRSYRAVADHFGVSKTGVANRARKDGWPGHVADRERAAEARLAESADAALDDVAQRHLKLVRFVQRKALEKLRSLPMGTTAEAVRALELGIRYERIIVGDPADEVAVADAGQEADELRALRREIDAKLRELDQREEELKLKSLAGAKAEITRAE
jgi:transposase